VTASARRNLSLDVLHPVTIGSILETCLILNLYMIDEKNRNQEVAPKTAATCYRFLRICDFMLYTKSSNIHTEACLRGI